MRTKDSDVRSRTKEIVRLLKHYYPEAHCSLDFSSPFELLIATMLSAQCTDARVNQVTKVLFKKYTDAVAMAKAKVSDLENIVRPTGFFKNKAKNLKSCSQKLVSEYSAEVPRTIEELVKLDGVGRKTANVVLGNAFGIPGMVVDTHVMRLTNRLGIAKGKNAETLEIELAKIVEKKDWINFSHWLINHGREVCLARKPRCEKCFLEGLCPKIAYKKS